MQNDETKNEYDLAAKNGQPHRRTEGLDSGDSVAISVGASVTGALVGLALGGAPGSLVGAAATPVLELSAKIFRNAWERRRERASQVLEHGLMAARLSPEEAVRILDSDDDLADSLFGLLRLASESDPATDLLLSTLIAELLRSTQATDRERLIIMGDAVRNLRSIHIRILDSIHAVGGQRSASDIAIDVAVPEAELRGVVRDLELRGMIKDADLHPIEWRIRELGAAVIRMTRDTSKEASR